MALSPPVIRPLASAPDEVGARAPEQDESAPSVQVEQVDPGPSPLGQQIDVLRARAVGSRTPAQMARRLGLEPKWLADLLASHGVHMSGGASHGNTFTGNDLKVFDAALKERLFDEVVRVLGAPALVAKAGGASPDWWTTPGGGLATSVASQVGIDMAFTTKDRQPIPLWKSRMVWVGLAFGLFLCLIPPVGIVVLAVWRGSYLGWRDGSKSSPQAAVALGILLVACVLLAVIGPPLAPYFAPLVDAIGPLADSAGPLDGSGMLIIVAVAVGVVLVGLSLSSRRRQKR